jgi:Zn-finger nucleic acid-binding protein
MRCPICKEVDLVMSNRQGVEIDCCPQCSGIWFDRGELDKIIEGSIQNQHQSSYQPSSQPQFPYPLPGYPQMTNTPAGNPHLPYNDPRYRKHDSHYDHPHLMELFFSKKFRKIAMVLVPVGIVILIGIGILVYPIMGRLWDYVSTTGFKGITDAVIGWIRQLWEGSKG